MGYCNWGFPFMHGGFLFGHGPVGLLLTFLLLAVVVYALVHIGKSIFARSGGNRDTSDSLEILRARFARGEITAEEYQRMREILSR